MLPSDVNLCQKRAFEVPLEIEGRLIGVIGREPISQEETDKIQPLYLDRSQGSTCAYPIRSTHADLFNPRDILAPHFQTGPGFGIPSRLESNGAFHQESGALYDPSRDLFYVRQAQGRNWYLVGGVEAYGEFMRGITSYVGQLEEIWEREPWRIFFQSDWRPEPSPPQKDLALDEVLLGLDKFLPWLQKNDPDLFRETVPHLDIRLTAPPAPWSEKLLCRNRFVDSAYAMYDSQLKKILLLPPALQWVVEGHFETVAQVLAHESAHQGLLESGRTMPTPELMARSLTHFLNRLAQRGVEERFLVEAWGDQMFMAAQCNLLPVIPEEEIQANAKEVAYAFSRTHDRIDADLAEEALDLSDLMWRKMGAHFPAGWSRLAATYFFGALRDEPSWLRDSPGTSDILNLFRRDAQRREACLNSEEALCRDPSVEMKELGERIAKHREEISVDGPSEN